MAWMPKKIKEEDIIHEVVIPNRVIGYWAHFYINGISYRQYLPGDGLEDTYELVSFKQDIRLRHGLAEDHDIRLVEQWKYNN